MQRRPRTGNKPRVYPPSVVADGAQLGDDVVVGAFCFVARGAVVGSRTRIQSHTSVWDGVVLGEDVFVGPGAQFTNVRHPRAAFTRAPRWDRTSVEDGRDRRRERHARRAGPCRALRDRGRGRGRDPRRSVSRHRRGQPSADHRLGVRVRRDRRAGRTRAVARAMPGVRSRLRRRAAPLTRRPRRAGFSG